MTPFLDPEDEDHRYAERRLQGEIVIWLTTVAPDGQPQASPVWFRWDGETFLIWSRPRSKKLPNIRANPRVSLNLDGDGEGGGIVTMEGTAQIDEDLPLVRVPEYVEKYRQEIGRLGSRPEPFSKDYSVAIRVVPNRIRVWQ